MSEIGEQQDLTVQAASFTFNFCCKSTQVVRLQGKFLPEIVCLAGSEVSKGNREKGPTACFVIMTPVPVKAMS